MSSGAKGGPICYSKKRAEHSRGNSRSATLSEPHREACQIVVETVTKAEAHRRNRVLGTRAGLSRADTSGIRNLYPRHILKIGNLVKDQMNQNYCNQRVTWI